MHTCILLAYMFIDHIHAWCLWKPKEGVRSPWSLMMAVSCQVDVYNYTQAFWKNSQCL